MAVLDDSASAAEVDRLYQLPLDQFIKARSDLARRLAGKDAAAIRALPKPTVLAWALNQLYWSKRKTFDQLVATAARFRATQADALLGKRADLRAAGDEHRDAIRESLREAVGILQVGGHAVTPDAVRELTGALEALPWKEAPGRLARPPVASGFDALAGLPMLAEPARQEDRRLGSVDRGVGEVSTTAGARSASVSRQEHQAALRTARAAAAAAQREEAQAASRLQKVEREVEAAAEREKAARRALADAERDRSRAEEEKRAANAALEGARRAAAEASRRLGILEGH